MTLSKRGLVGHTPSHAKGNPFGGLDAASISAASPMAASEISKKFQTKLRVGGIPTPLGSTMSRAKFDFSGYDPKAMRKKKQETPTREVVKKVEEDCELFTTDIKDEAPSFGDLDDKNLKGSRQLLEKVQEQIYDPEYHEQ